MFAYKIIDQFPTKRVIDIRTYYYNNAGHRIYGPSVQHWYSHGVVLIEEWLIHDKRHRENGPAFQKYLYNSVLAMQEWRIHGELHRIDGPAYIEWYTIDVALTQRTYLYGIEIANEINEINVWATDMNIDLNVMSPAEIALLKLTWGIK